MRVLLKALAGVAHVNELKHFKGAFQGGLLVQVLVEHDRFSDLATDGEERIEGSHRFLENHRDFAAADFADFGAAWIELREVYGIAATAGGMEADFTVDDFAGRLLEQAHDRTGSDAFAAAAFTDDAEGGLAREVEVDAINGADDALVGEKVGTQITNFKNVIRSGSHCHWNLPVHHRIPSGR